MSTLVKFVAGRNIAMKVPPHVAHRTAGRAPRLGIDLLSLGAISPREGPASPPELSSTTTALSFAQTTQRMHEGLVRSQLLADRGGHARQQEALCGYDGVKHFSLWSLSDAAQACFGTAQWPSNVRIPQANLEFEVDGVEAAAKELEARGYTLLHATRTEPWQQTIARLLSPEGLIVGVCHTPWLHPSP